MTCGKRKADISPDRAAKVSLVLSRRRKNAPRTTARTRRTRRASLHPNRIRRMCRMTSGLTWHRHRKNCCVTTLRPSRHGPHRKILAAGMQCWLVAMMALPFPRPSVRNFRPASAHKRRLRPQASPSGGAPHAGSASPDEPPPGGSQPACACRIPFRVCFPF
jgi:hypothetical protein